MFVNLKTSDVSVSVVSSESDGDGDGRNVERKSRSVSSQDRPSRVRQERSVGTTRPMKNDLLKMEICFEFETKCNFKRVQLNIKYLHLKNKNKFVKF